MNLSLTPEQVALAETLKRALVSADPETIRRVWDIDYLRIEYERITQMGLLEVVVAAADTRSTLLPEVVVLGASLGAHAALVPIETVAFVSIVLTDCDVEAELVRILMTGSSVWSFASYERRQRDFAEPPLCRLQHAGSGLTLTGEKCHVDYANHADGFVVTCIGPDGQTALALVPRDASGVVVEPTKVLGGMASGRVRFDSAKVRTAVLQGQGVDNAVRRAWSTVLLLQSAYLVGAARRVVDMTRIHVTEREQFGAPLLSKQAVRHHVANAIAALEGAELLVEQTAWLGGQNRRLGLSAETKAWSAQVAGDVARTGHLLHGGVGVVDDHELSLLSRRITAESIAYGRPSEMLRSAGRSLRGAIDGMMM